MINQDSIKSLAQKNLNKYFKLPDYGGYCFSGIPGTIENIFNISSKNSILPYSVFSDLIRKNKKQFCANQNNNNDIRNKTKRINTTNSSNNFDNIDNFYNIDDIDNVIFILVDGFGWNYFEKMKDKISVLQDFVNKNDVVVSKISSQFPSTTAAHITTMASGLPLSKTGIFEWMMYDPNFDAIITPLKYAFNDSEQQDELLNFDIDIVDVLPLPKFLQNLVNNQVKIYKYLNKSFANSAYNNYMHQDSEIIPIQSLTEALVNMRLNLDNLNSQSNKHQVSKNYHYLYFGHYDSITHKYGPGKIQSVSELETFWMIFERFFWKYLQESYNGRNLLFLTADHGQILIDPDKVFYLNLEIPEIVKYIQRSSNIYKDSEGKNRLITQKVDKNDKMKISKPQGKLLAPAGSPNDMFLYIKKSHLDYVYKILKFRLKDIAKVYKTQELIDLGVFGKKKDISKRFRERVGNIVILPFSNRPVWWFEEDIHELTKQGMHGGLRKEEMEIPLIVYRF